MRQLAVVDNQTRFNVDDLEALPAGIFRVDPEGYLRSGNKTWWAICGASEDSALGALWYSGTHPLDTYAVEQCFEASVGSLQDIALETRFVSPAGKVVFAKIHLVPELDKLERLSGFIGAAFDISTLVQSQDQLLDILNSLSDVVLLVGETGRILRVNPAVSSMLAYQPHELLGEHCGLLVVPDQRARLNSVLLGLLKGSVKPADVGILNFSGQIKSGLTIDLEMRIDKSGLYREAPGFIVVLRDVSERKRREMYLNEAEKMSALVQVTRGVSHEFTNLLSTMMGNLELLARGLPRADVENFVEPSLQAGERGRELVQHLLSFNRQRPLNEAVIVAADFIQNQIESQMFSATAVELEIEPAADNARIRVDPAYLAEALQHLVENAAEARANGGIDTVLVHLELSWVELKAGMKLPGYSTGEIRESEVGSYLRISVSDNGPGMDSLVLERCFDPFFSTREGQMGLGLSSLVGFIQQCDGFVSIDSPGPGAEAPWSTSVHLYLPGLTDAEVS